MELRVCYDIGKVVDAVNQWFETQINLGLRSFYIPAGETPRPVYQNWNLHPPVFLKQIQLFQIDEIQSGKNKGLFSSFLKQALPSYENKIKFIEFGEDQAEGAFLGLGRNGHVAFHEPQISKNLFSGCVRLEPETCERLELEAQTWGLTYGLGAFLKCQSLLLVVTGESKKEIFSQLLMNSEGVPAHYLLRHPQLTVVVDRKVLSKGVESIAEIKKGTLYKKSPFTIKIINS
ncbi:MAG: 6-phosphogluconolactonase [Bdellovibrionales bacterium]|nr:6-phosphogluconolactonase [Bdellovibrionales bacterium]